MLGGGSTLLATSLPGSLFFPFLEQEREETLVWSGHVCEQQSKSPARGPFKNKLYPILICQYGCGNHAMAIFCCDVLSVFMSLCARAATVTLIIGHNS